MFVVQFCEYHRLFNSYIIINGRGRSQMDSTEEMSPDVVERVSAAISHFVFYLYALMLFMMPALVDPDNSFQGMLLWWIIPPFVCFMIYIAVRKSSPFTAFHTRQALVFDLITAGGVVAIDMLFGTSL